MTFVEKLSYNEMAFRFRRDDVTHSINKFPDIEKALHFYGKSDLVKRWFIILIYRVLFGNIVTQMFASIFIHAFEQLFFSFVLHLSSFGIWVN